MTKKERSIVFGWMSSDVLMDVIVEIGEAYTQWEKVKKNRKFSILRGKVKLDKVDTFSLGDEMTKRKRSSNLANTIFFFALSSYFDEEKESEVAVSLWLHLLESFI